MKYDTPFSHILDYRERLAEIGAWVRRRMEDTSLTLEPQNPRNQLTKEHNARTWHPRA